MYVSAIGLGREYTNSTKKIFWRSKPKWASGHFKFWRSFQCSWLFYKSKLSKTVQSVYSALFFLVWIAQWLSRPPPGPCGPQPAAFPSPTRGGSLLDSRPLVRWRYLTTSSSASPSFNFHTVICLSSALAAPGLCGCADRPPAAGNAGCPLAEACGLLPERLLLRSAGSGGPDFTSSSLELSICSSQTPGHRLNSCGAPA